MYAVIETGGKQIKVEPGIVVRVEKLPVAPGEEITFDKVLLVREDSSVLVGKPYVEGFTVTGQVMDHIKDRKVIIFKHKRRKNYRKKIGHRQLLSVVAIRSINSPGDTPSGEGV
ncbi:MAG: 50S ribosomal protein L21 [Thermodesulforhabdaceae bacterium]